VVGLDIDPDGLDRVAAILRTAGQALAAGLGLGADGDVAPVGGDAVSQAVMANLNGRRHWLIEHVRAGHEQSLAAAELVAGNAAVYRATDAAAAATYGQPAATATPAASTPSLASVAPPPPLPQHSNPIPDISGSDGHELAMALETGAGPGPATEAATSLAALATHVSAAGAQFAAAHAALNGAGHSDVHAPLGLRLVAVADWSQALAAHAADLAAGYSSAVAAAAGAYEAVGPSAQWQALKTGYEAAVQENIATGGLAQPVVDAYAQALTERQQAASAGMSGYQGAGQMVSTPPGALPPPGLAPDAMSEDHSDTDPLGKKKHRGDEDGAATDLISPVMGALGPMVQSAGKLNPLGAVGQVGQLGSQLAGAAHPKSGFKPAAVAHTAGKTLSGGKGIGGGGKGVGGGKGTGGGGKGVGGGKGIGGGGAIKAAGIGSSAALHPASATPPSTAVAAGTTADKAASGPSRSGAGGGGMGMMPMGRGMGGDAASRPVTSYPGDPLPEVPTTATAGVVADTTPTTAAVDPAARKAVLDRIAKRKQATATVTDSA
jgi:hypothetical protein